MNFKCALVTLVSASALAGCIVNLPSPSSTSSDATQTLPAPPTMPNQNNAPPPVGAATTPTQNNITAPVEKPPVPAGSLTEEEARKIIREVLTAVYQADYMKDEEFSMDFGPVQIGAPTKEKLYGGHFAEPIDVWPVRTDVTIKWQREGVEGKTWELGTQNREIYYFYKDEVGSWAFKTSSF